MNVECSMIVIYFQLFKLGAYILFVVSRSKRFCAGSVLKFSNNQVKNTILFIYFYLFYMAINVNLFVLPIKNNFIY